MTCWPLRPDLVNWPKFRRCGLGCYCTWWAAEVSSLDFEDHHYPLTPTGTIARSPSAAHLPYIPFSRSNSKPFMGFLHIGLVWRPECMVETQLIFPFTQPFVPINTQVLEIPTLFITCYHNFLGYSLFHLPPPIRCRLLLWCDWSFIIFYPNPCGHYFVFVITVSLISTVFMLFL